VTFLTLSKMSVDIINQNNTRSALIYLTLGGMK